MMNQPESENANRMMYREWYPAIMYNHHQTGPAGAVLFAPPFRDPFNYHFDPLIPLGIDLVGAAIHTRLAVEGKPGAVMRSAAPLLDLVQRRHPDDVVFPQPDRHPHRDDRQPDADRRFPFVPEMQLRRADVPNPIAPQRVALPAVDRVLDDDQLRHPRHRVRAQGGLPLQHVPDGEERDRARAAATTGRSTRSASSRCGAAIAKQNGGSGRGGAPVAFYNDVLHDPAARDPRGFIIPSDQPDFLDRDQVRQHPDQGAASSCIARRRRSRPAARRIPAGSYVVKAAQPFRAHVMDMFEPQDHPNDIPYPGGPPRAPYDVTGYNPVVLDGHRVRSHPRRLRRARSRRCPTSIKPSPGRFTAAPQGGAYVISAQVNDAFVAVNRLLKANQGVSRAARTFNAGGALVSGRHDHRAGERDDAAASCRRPPRTKA